MYVDCYNIEFVELKKQTFFFTNERVDGEEVFNLTKMNSWT